MTVDRLTGLDITHLVADEMGWPGHIGAIAILDGVGLLDDGGEVRVDLVRAAVAERIHLSPRLRQTVVSPPPGLGGPLWVDAVPDLTHHVRLHPLPPPAGEEQLLEAVERLRRRPFDQARPLWELWLMPGLQDQQVGLFIKLHHAVADGSAAVNLLGLLLGPAATPRAPGTTAGATAGASMADEPALTRLNAADLRRDNLRRGMHGLATTASALMHPVRTLNRARSMWPAVREVMTERRAPRTSLNRPIGVERRLALVRHSLAATKDAAHVAGATVNDVILAAVAGGLREALQARGERVDGLVLRVSVPVSLHRRPDAARGNLDGPMAVPVPVGEPDAARRLRLIAAETAARRVRARPRVFVGVLGSRRVQRVLMRYMRHQRMVNAYVANVVGPPKPLMLAGARLLEVFPMVPITANLTLGIGVLSYAGQLNLTVVADRDSWPDLPVFLEGLDRAWSQLA